MWLGQKQEKSQVPRDSLAELTPSLTGKGRCEDIPKGKSILQDHFALWGRKPWTGTPLFSKWHSHYGNRVLLGESPAGQEKMAQPISTELYEIQLLGVPLSSLVLAHRSRPATRSENVFSFWHPRARWTTHSRTASSKTRVLQIGAEGQVQRTVTHILENSGFSCTFLLHQNLLAYLQDELQEKHP